ncbi:immunoglobulin-like domain-containing protein [Halobacillus yeomjeoni]|uniref:Bacterial Ig-like domain-containing protein n=1 Tax=Halobacillus yeomjeoni TaxID=311194 RepID=A0A931HTA8_9BACI|nr:immunoglobulin-like domain-containing protein [Halobacillus yeomjeoni]MBH0229355.1 hypothetical protein [Halobacillus yeomjeoni]
MQKRIAVFVCLIVIIIGCSSGNTKMVSQVIPGKIGSPNNELSFSDHRPWTSDEVYAKTEYEPFTGKYFKGLFINNPFFMAEPKEDVGSFEAFPEQKVRVQLVERNRELEKLRIVREEIFTEGEKLTVQLPEENGVLYSYSQEILGDEGEVLDTDVVMYYVPPRELNAQVSIEEQTAEHLTLQVENWGPTWLFFGKDYFIQEYEDGNWKTITLTRSVEDIGYELSPGEVLMQQIHLEDWDLDKGKYRVVQPLKAKDTDIKKQLAAGFTVD